MGTVDYVAPEQFKGGEIDGRADVYSLGCVLYECIHRCTAVQQGLRGGEWSPPTWKTVPASELQSARGCPLHSPRPVQKAMAKRPEERFATAGEMADALRGGSRVGLGPNRRWLAGAIAAAVLAVAAIVFVASAGNDGSPDASFEWGRENESDRFARRAQCRRRLEFIKTPNVVGAAGGDLPEIEAGEGGVWTYVPGGTSRAPIRQSPNRTMS